MGKRYGRNQKRRHRERIEELEKTMNNLLHSHNRLGAELQDLKYQFRNFLNDFEKWWKYSVLTDPKVHEHQHEFPPQFQVIEDTALSPLPSPHSFYDVTMTIERKVQTLEALRVAVEHDLGQRHMHMILAIGKNQYRYYIDERAFDSFEGMPAKMIEYAWKEIVYAFKKKFHKRR